MSEKKDWTGALGALIEKSDNPVDVVGAEPDRYAVAQDPVKGPVDAHGEPAPEVMPLPTPSPIFDAAAQERVSELEYEVSGLKNEVQKLTALLAARLEDDREEEGWKDIYRLHPPEIKGYGVKVTTSIRGDGGHVYEKGYRLQIRDVEGEEPRIRVRRQK